MTYNVKTFLIMNFEEGVRTGNKASPVRVAKEMKILRNEDGEPTFKPEEWTTTQRISGLLLRQTAAQRHKGLYTGQIPEEGIVAGESKVAFHALRGLVMEDLGKPSHPIIVGYSNVCDLVKDNKLDLLKLPVLSEICQQLHLTTD